MSESTAWSPRKESAGESSFRRTRKGSSWDAARLLGQACLRAGLPEESWKAAGSVRLRRFTAETF